MPAHNITALVSVDRGRYLRQNETQIRGAASNALAASGKRDHLLEHAFNAVLYCEDLFDRHQVAVTAHRAANREHVAKDHERFAEMALQLKLRNLDMLCHHVGF